MIVVELVEVERFPWHRSWAGITVLLLLNSTGRRLSSFLGHGGKYSDIGPVFSNITVVCGIVGLLQA